LFVPHCTGVTEYVTPKVKEEGSTGLTSWSYPRRQGGGNAEKKRRKKSKKIRDLGKPDILPLDAGLKKKKGNEQIND